MGMVRSMVLSRGLQAMSRKGLHTGPPLSREELEFGQKVGLQSHSIRQVLTDISFCDQPAPTNERLVLLGRHVLTFLMLRSHWPSLSDRLARQESLDTNVLTTITSKLDWSLSGAALDQVAKDLGTVKLSRWNMVSL